MGQIFKEGVTWIWLIIENEPDNYRCLKAMQIDVHLKEKNTCLYRKAPFLPSCSDCPLSPLGFLLVWTASPYPPRPASASVRNTGNILAAVHYLPTCLLWWLVPSLLLLLCPLSNSLPLETLKKSEFLPALKFVALPNLRIQPRHPSLLWRRRSVSLGLPIVCSYCVPTPLFFRDQACPGNYLAVWRILRSLIGKRHQQQQGNQICVYALCPRPWLLSSAFSPGQELLSISPQEAQIHP